MIAARMYEIQKSSLRADQINFPSGTLSLAVGDPAFATPEPVLRAAHEAAVSGLTHYCEPQGDYELRSAIAARAARPDVTAAEVLVTHGGTAGITSTMLGLIDPGDKVVIPQPTYSLYADAVRLAGGRPVAVGKTSDFRLDIRALDEACTGAKLLVICNPTNPTGTVLSSDELLNVTDIVRRHNLLVFFDEAYAEIVYEPYHFTSSLESRIPLDNLIYCQTFSKTYSMTGWRLGFIIASAKHIPSIDRAHRIMNGPINTIVQRAGLAALGLDKSYYSDLRNRYTERRALACTILAEAKTLAPVEPEGTFYLFARYTGRLTDIELGHRLADERVAVRTGREFGPGGEHCIRISFAVSPDVLREGLSRVVKATANA